MPRTTSTLVTGVLQGDYDAAPLSGNPPPDLAPYIRSAYNLISRVAICATKKGITLSSDELADLETWMAAFFYCIGDPSYSSRSTQGASGSFQNAPARKGFGANKYGSTAMAMDYSGCLENISEKQRASMVWLGKTTREQLRYDQRM